MKALVLKEINELVYSEVPKPIPQKGEALIKIMACGVCGSDIPRSYRDGAHNMPLIIGHEMAGIVEEVGNQADSNLIGKRVVVFPLIPCRKCGPCRNKHYEMCKDYDYRGSRSDGGFAQYLIAPIWNLLEIPDEVSFKAAAMTEPMAVAVHAIKRVEINLWDTVVVCGLGTIGTLLTMFLLDRGVKNIIVIGNKEFQKQTVLGLGIREEEYCDSRKEDPREFIMKATQGEGADVFFECVGRNETASLAIDSVGASGRVCMVGNPYSDMMFEKNVYWKILRNQIKVTGTWNSSFLGKDGDEQDDWKYVLSRIKEGFIDPEKLITHEYSLKDIHKGFELMRDKSEDYIKVMYLSELDDKQ